MKSAPCKDCTERHPGCHSECEKYKEYSRERTEMCKRKSMDLEADIPMANMRIKQHWKWWSKRRR